MVGPKIVIAIVLVDLNLAVQYGIAINIIIMRVKKKLYWRIIIWQLHR